MPISTHGRNINLCFTKIKWPLAPQSPNSMSPVPQLPDHDHNHALVPSTTTSSTLIRNFNSLYDDHTFNEFSTSKSLSKSPAASSSYKPDPTATNAEDFASAFASHRFFFSSPGPSNSIVESTTDESSLPYIAHAQEPVPEKLFENSVAVPTYSPDPYADFRRSMQEMVEARELVDVKSNWEFLHELLLCYLALNPKSTHKFILGAFADLVIGLMSQPPGG
ncbi:transcription repressor OFP12-like [Juglans regia]|uniref:Transcription repressor n=1 Tax=Juglans regia TaxID=51240 RepID=A0A6P9E547_JUGRE|nr:transcription repressor OFP12-like [Juglans regia]